MTGHPIHLSRKALARLGLVIDAAGQLAPMPTACRRPRQAMRQAKPRPPTLREAEIVAERRGATLTLVLPTPPRPKKNSTRVVWTRRGPTQRQAPSYYQFVNDVCLAILPRARALGLPLPGREAAPHGYHIRATFYCDNDRSDEKNLEQGLADALERAGVVTSDQLFESWDGSRRLVDRTRPRVELRITRRRGPRRAGLEAREA